MLFLRHEQVEWHNIPFSRSRREHFVLKSLLILNILVLISWIYYVRLHWGFELTYSGKKVLIPDSDHQRLFFSSSPLLNISWVRVYALLQSLYSIDFCLKFKLELRWIMNIFVVSSTILFLQLKIFLMTFRSWKSDGSEIINDIYSDMLLILKKAVRYKDLKILP